MKSSFHLIDHSLIPLLMNFAGEFISGLDGSSGKTTIVLGKKSDGMSVSPSQQPVLVANSKGVVKVDPRTLPNISSGVYVMSTKPGPNGASGLVKVDPSNVKVVTGKDTIVSIPSENFFPLIMLKLQVQSLFWTIISMPLCGYITTQVN